MFSLISIQIAISYVDFKYIQVVFETKGDVLSTLFDVNYIVGRDVGTYYHIEFLSSGDNPFISVSIHWRGNKTDVMIGSAKVTIFSSLFSMQNGSSRRIGFWDDTYHRQFYPNVSKKAQGGYLCTYSINLTDSIREAKTRFANKTGLTTAEQSNLGARIVFETSGVDSTIEEGQERRLDFLFQNNKANLLLFVLSVTIPEDSDFVGKPVLEGMEMNKVLKRVEGTVSVEPYGIDLYKAIIEWRVPKAPAFWEIPPTSWILSAVLGGLTVSIPLSLLSAYLWRRIDKKLALQKTERSINYVKGRITGVYADLIWRMRPPKDWEKRFKRTNSNWDDFYEDIWNVKENALSSLETILDRYHYLIDAELTNDVLEMVDLLRDSVWIIANPSILRKRAMTDLSNTANQISVIVTQAINTIKSHKLLYYSVFRVARWSEGEPPKIERYLGKIVDVEAMTESHYLSYEKTLEESIKFRDECQKRMIRSSRNKRKEEEST
ncbi:MAG: hypothetical protein OEY40_00935 [Candidatus Bathyarchaeota archaeon]|nr:hypothetical protein [Candidatus Bathyarchaeota archaeon]